MEEVEGLLSGSQHQEPSEHQITWRKWRGYFQEANTKNQVNIKLDGGSGGVTFRKPTHHKTESHLEPSGKGKEAPGTEKKKQICQKQDNNGKNSEPKSKIISGGKKSLMASAMGSEQVCHIN